jgi:hypothetical protein
MLLQRNECVSARTRNMPQRSTTSVSPRLTISYSYPPLTHEWYTPSAMTTQRDRALCSVALTIASLSGCLSNDEVPFTRVRAPANAGGVSSGAGSEVDVGGSAASDAPEILGMEGSTELDLALPRDDMAASAEARDAEVDEAPAAPSALAPVSPCAVEGLLSCDDFEAATPGSFPSDQPWLPELPGCGSHRVEESGVSHSGGRALRAGAEGYPECMLHASLSLEAPLYLRAWIRLDTQATSQNQYVSVLELGARDDRDDPELRIGVRSAADNLCPGAPGVDVSMGGIEGGPRTECSGVVLEAERWYCFQARLSLQARQLEVSLQVDAEPAVEAAYAGLDAAWNARDLYFKLGRASYGGPAAGAVWHDDVALGPEPIPCEPPAEPAR